MPAAEGTDPLTSAEIQALFTPLDGEPVLILAVSGGPDSTALMWLAARWRKELQRGPKLLAVTVDHGLRPQSRTEARAVADLARRLGVTHRTLRWTGRKPKTGLPEAARIARYRLLARAAREAGAQYVLTAHTLDDQAETVLIRLSRGSGVAGLAAMARCSPLPDSGKGEIHLHRPLLSVRKARLVASLKAARVPYADDPTNRDPRFTRARLRASMPALEREGLTADRLARLAQRVARAEAALHYALQAALRELAAGPWPAGGPVTIDPGPFADLPEEIALRVVGRAIDSVGDEGPVELGKLEALSEGLSNALEDRQTGPGSGRFRRTLAGAVVTLDGKGLRIERAPARRARKAPNWP